MYNRYLPPDTPFRPIPPEEGPGQAGGQPRRPHRQERPSQSRPGKGGELLDGLTDTLKDTLGGLFRNFSLDRLDSGDILLLLIILFLFLEGDNLDLVIALGLMLLLSLGDAPDEEAQPST